MDIYDLILSDEIREYLRANHVLSIEEKILIIHTAYISIEEKYAALQALLEETEDQEDREMLSQMCRLYDWAFEQLHSEMPGQIFISADYKDRKNGETRSAYLVDGVFHTYEEVKEFFASDHRHYWPIGTVTATGFPDDIDHDPKDILKLDCIEKWACVDGKFEFIISFDVYLIGKHCCLRDFFVEDRERTFEEIVARLGISERVAYLFCGDKTNALPLPFKHGDLVCLDLPCWTQPLYGVMLVAYDTPYYEKEPELWLEMFFPDKFYPDNDHLYSFCMSCWNIDFYPNLPVIHWLRHAEPSELPDGQKKLAELSSGLHRLMEFDKKAAEEILIPEGYQYIQDVIDEINSILNEKNL